MAKPPPVLLALLMALTSSLSPSPRRVLNFANQISQSSHRQPTAILSTISPITRQDEEKLLQCQGCKRTFNSRNALFKHIRGDDEASADCPIAMQAKPMLEEELLMTTVIRYGYYGELDGSTEIGLAMNDVVASMIHEAFVHHVNGFLDGENALHGDGNLNLGRSQFREGKIFDTTALSYSSAAIMRQPALRQDEEVVGAASEVLSFNYRLRFKPTTITRWKEYATSGIILEHLQAWLDKGSCSVKIQLFHMDALVPRSSKFYAERSATQRCYTFLLPVKWILGEAEDEGRRSEAMAEVIDWSKNLSKRSLSHPKHEPRAAGLKKLETPACILELKKSLKATESETVPNRRLRRQAERKKNDDDAVAGDTFDEVSNSIGSGDMNSNSLTSDTSTRLSHGRFGQLWRKEKKCWSNFSSLTGMAASPGYEAVWRTMDRAKIVGVIDLKDGKDEKDESDDVSMEDTIQSMHIIIEFIADGFVVGSIPRIISAVVAMTNSWLPQNFFEIATRPEVYIPPPPPPPSLHRLYYFQSARYHFHELASNAHEGNDRLSAFARTIQFAGLQSEKWEEQLREKLNSGVASIGSSENEWLLELRDVVSPNLRQHVESSEAEHLIDQSQLLNRVQDSSRIIFPSVETDSPMGAFSVTLDSLRDVVENGKWPATSEARSRVIKSPAGSSGNILATKKKMFIASSFPGNSISSGSFTVINENIWQSGDLPLGNALFPQLRKAVFELEEEIIRQRSPLPAADGMELGGSLDLRRSPSTHCAVNRNGESLWTHSARLSVD